MRNFFNTPLEEKETLIHIYTTRVASMKRLEKDIGKADILGKILEEIASMEWSLSFDNRKVLKKALSLRNLIPFK